MINITDFIHRFAAWRKEKGTVPANTPDQSAEAAFLKLEERKSLLQATVMEKKIKQLQTVITDAEQTLKTLQEDLLRLQQQVEIQVPVATGETLSFTVQQSVPVPAVAKHQYYDPALLPQESDDLLFYV